MMNNVVRQDGDEDYKAFLHRLRMGDLTLDDCNWMITKCLDQMQEDVSAKYIDALHICSTWKEANAISYKYLQEQLTKPIAILRAEMGTNNNGTHNCYEKGNVLPVIAVICVGCIVMLLNNKVVEEDLFNGSVGIVRDICYKPGEKMGTMGS